MKRRVLLAGLGTASIGVGAAFGSGAFTSIEADRDVELNVSNDSDAQIIFRRNDDATGADRLIEDDDTNAVDVIRFSRSDLNEQSRTSFEKALEVKNNTAENGEGLDVDLFVEENDDVGIEDEGILDFRVDDDNGDTSVVGDDNDIRIEEGETEQIDIVVDLRGDDINDNENDLEEIEQVTFVVEAVDEDE